LVKAPPPSPALSGLGARLRAIREDAGLSGIELADVLGAGWRQSKVSKIETGRQLPSIPEVTAWAEATGVDAAPLLALRAKAGVGYTAWKDRIAGAGGPMGAQDELTALQASCAFLAEYQPALIPGRLQTPTYMREMTQGDDVLVADGISPEQLGHVIAAKVRRQSIMYEPGREIVHVIGEAALRTRIRQVSVATLVGQISHLIEMAALPGHTFAVMPYTAPSPFPPVSGWAMFDRDLVRLETLTGGIQITDPAMVARYSRWLEQLLAVALTGADAVEFCRGVATSLGAEG
jgi:transcriptional regulator with XRE-family HTH domain